MAKQTNIRRRGDSWCVYFRANRGQVWRSFADSKHGGTKPAREAAELYLANVRLQKARGESPRGQKRIRFRDFAAEWLLNYAATNVSAKTYEGYEGVLRVHLVPAFGDWWLAELTRKEIDAFVADWAAGGPRFQARLAQLEAAEQQRAAREGRKARPVRPGRSPKTIANALVPLREMLGHAVEWDHIATNPAAGVRRPRAERQHDEMNALSPEQIRGLLGAAPTVEARTLILCAVTTGIRRGEQLGLRWGDVDWHTRRLHVRRSIGLNSRVQQPKTRTSIRAVAMTPTLVAALREHRMRSPFKSDDDYIFVSETGSPLDGGNMVKRNLHPALRRAKLARIRWHDLRHCFASLLIAQGAHPKYIAEQLGHASVQITLDRYGHLMDQSYGDASDRLEATLFGATSQSATGVTR